ncbi:Thyrotropin receptor [Orchesella cincta]|uniref:Thyrotropin receptor n=1 Tax=Orchesella cincta TaxID=48709 RepID=A0A1D2MIN8_ORCCI|nr:Thyrotropin receptor [Orchesella cincta]
MVIWKATTFGDFYSFSQIVWGSVSGGSGGIFAGLCPEPLCECQLDSRGRMEISCENGQMTDIPTLEMNPSTEVIKIVGPREKPNFLTIGRLFKQFKRLEELYISVFHN